MKKCHQTILLMLICVCPLISCKVKMTNQLSIPNVNECDTIIIEEFLTQKEHVFIDKSPKTYILNVLRQDSKAEVCKMYPKLIITIKGENYNENFGINGEFIKKDGKSYKYPINIEKELYKYLNE